MIFIKLFEIPWFFQVEWQPCEHYRLYWSLTWCWTFLNQTIIRVFFFAIILSSVRKKTLLQKSKQAAWWFFWSICKVTDNQGTHPPHVTDIRVMLHRLKHQFKTLKELDAAHWRHAHVEKHAEQNRKRHMLQNRTHQHRHTWRREIYTKTACIPHVITFSLCLRLSHSPPFELGYTVNS